MLNQAVVVCARSFQLPPRAHLATTFSTHPAQTAMTARIQQLITLAALALAALWVWTFVRQGQLLWALLAPLALLSILGAVLALEFVLLRLVHAADLTPRATASALASAWWGELLAAVRVFCWRQPFKSQDYPDLVPQQGAEPQRRGAVLVHGYFCNRGLWNRWLQRLREQGTPFIAVDLEPVFGSIDSLVPVLESAVSTLEQQTGQAPVVVAHSMGGLVLRRWYAKPGNEHRLHHAITLGTPHQGTWLARLAFTVNAREMRQGAAWLGCLSGDETTTLHSRMPRFTCFYSNCDNIVFPPATATLPGADNRHLPGVAHVDMVDMPQPWEELKRWLAMPTEPTAPAASDALSPDSPRG